MHLLRIATAARTACGMSISFLTRSAVKPSCWRQAVRLAKRSPAISTGIWPTRFSNTFAFTPAFSRGADIRSVLPALVAVQGAERTLDLEPRSHRVFSSHAGLEGTGHHARRSARLTALETPRRISYWYVPPDIRETLNLRDAELAEIRNTTPLPKFPDLCASDCKNRLLSCRTTVRPRRVSAINAVLT